MEMMMTDTHADMGETKKYKMYESVKTKNRHYKIMGAVDVFNNVMGGIVSLYEGIFNGCKPYFDYDIKYDTEQQQLQNEKPDINGAVGEVVDYLGCAVQELAVFTANGYNGKAYINSIHIIANNGRFYNNGEELKQDITEYGLMSCDMSVYGRSGRRKLFRVAGAVKEGQRGRPFIKIDPETLEPITMTAGNYHEGLISVEGGNNGARPCEIERPPTLDESNIIKLFMDILPDIAKCFVYRSTTGEQGEKQIINLNRISPSHCDICNKTHDRDNTGYLIKHGETVFYGCNRAKGSKMICLNSTGIYTVADRIKNAIRNGNKLSRDDHLEKLKLDFERANMNPIVSNVRWCSDIPELMDDMVNTKSSIVAVLANLGTGKTVANVKAVKIALENNPYLRVLVVSMRISLADKYKIDYEGFTCYRDKKGELVEDKLISQLDSLNRIKWTRESGEEYIADMVVIDEADQAIRHLYSKTYMKQPAVRLNIAILKNMIKMTKQIVLMSGNLTPKDIQFIKSIRNKPADTCTVYWNKYNINVKNVIISNDPAENINLIMQDVKEGKKPYVFSNRSLTYINAQVEQIRRVKANVEILTITRETLNKPEVIKALTSPNTEWGKYDVVYVSPTVQGGISYDIPETFNSIYGFVSNSTNSSGDTAQMMGRVRYPINNNIRVCMDITSPAGITNMQDLKNHIIINKEGIYNEVINTSEFDINKYGVVEFKNDGYFNDWLNNQISENLDRNNYIENFINIQIKYGNTVSMSEALNDTKKNEAIYKKINIETKEIKDTQATELATNISKANDIGLIEYLKLETKIKKQHDGGEQLTEQEGLEFKKHYIYNVYNLRQAPDDPVFYADYNNRTTMNHYKTLNLYYQGKTFMDGLELQKQQDMKRELATRQNYNEVNGTYDIEDTTAGIIKSINIVNKYEKHKLLISWLVLMGWEWFNDTTIKAEVLKAKLIEIYNNDFKNPDRLLMILGKHVRKIKAVNNIKPDDKKFVFNILNFINGTLREEFNISIKTTNNKRTKYHLYKPYFDVDENTQKQQFITVYNEDNIPRLGIVSSDVDEAPREPSMEEQLERLRKLQ